MELEEDNNGTKGISMFWDAAFGIAMLICMMILLVIVDGIARGWQ